MAVRLGKPWVRLSMANLQGIAAHLGVYQLGDDQGEILYIGVADARTRFGLRGELAQALADPPAGATRFRIEVTMSYRTRFAELLSVFLHDHGRLPVANNDSDRRVCGRLRPDGGLGQGERRPGTGGW